MLQPVFPEDFASLGKVVRGDEEVTEFKDAAGAAPVEGESAVCLACFMDPVRSDPGDCEECLLRLSVQHNVVLDHLTRDTSHNLYSKLPTSCILSICLSSCTINFCYLVIVR